MDGDQMDAVASGGFGFERTKGWMGHICTKKSCFTNTAPL
jgi:hypothetical protein